MNEAALKFSNEYLTELQSYPLNIKINLTKQRIREAFQRYNEDVYVSFSGGKDSEVCLDLVASVAARLGYDEIHALYVNTGLEYASVQKFCKPFCEFISSKYGINIILDVKYPSYKFIDVLKDYGYPIISKEVSGKIEEARKGISMANGKYQGAIDTFNGTRTDKNGYISPYNYPQYKFLLDAPFRISQNCCKKTKKAPAHEYETETGRIPIVGTMADESRLRRTSWLMRGCNAFDCDRPSSRPMSFWKQKDVLEYIYTKDLPIAPSYGKVKRHIKGTIKDQSTIFDICDISDEDVEYEYYTTLCERTGCLYCLFGITQDRDRILRLQKLEPKRTKFVLGGGEFDESGMWVPNKEGLGYAFILDYLAQNGIYIPYNKEQLITKETAA